MQLEASLALRAKLRSAFKETLASVDQLREDLLVMKGSIDVSIAEHEYCKSGLEDYVKQRQDDHSRCLRELAEEVYSFTQWLMLPGVRKPIFNLSEVRVW